jgi:hypothetical protein
VIAGYTAVLVAVALIAGVLAIALGLAGRKPSDLSLAGAALIELLLIVQLVLALLAPASGNRPTGNPVEFAAYLLSALIIPPAAIVWALLERTRWATVVVGIACLAIAVMVVRMQIIWTVQHA